MGDFLLTNLNRYIRSWPQIQSYFIFMIFSQVETHKLKFFFTNKKPETRWSAKKFWANLIGQISTSLLLRLRYEDREIIWVSRVMVKYDFSIWHCTKEKDFEWGIIWCIKRQKFNEIENQVTYSCNRIISRLPRMTQFVSSCLFSVKWIDQY